MLYQAINNVLGINPSFYEYFFMVDAGTPVDPLSINRLISAYVRFSSLPFYRLTMPCRIIDDEGVCSENACHSHMKNLLQLMRMCTAWPLMMVIIDMASTLTPSVLHRFRYLIIPKIVSW